MKRAVLLAVLVLLVAAPTAAQGTTPREAYNRLWREVDHFYGAEGQPPPFVRFRSFGPYCCGPALNGIRQVTLTHYTGHGLQRGKGRGARTAIHEWTHIFQRDDLLMHPVEQPWDERPGEIAATGFEDAVVARLFNRRPRPALDIGQFGANYGANPRTILWPYQ